MDKLNKRSPILLYIGLFLVAAVLISSYMVSGLYARYTTTATGSDSARVARFDVSNSIDSIEADIKLNFYDSAALSDEFQFTVESKSEVSLVYDVVVTLPSGSYGWLNITLDGKSADFEVGNVFTFENVSDFDVATNQSKVHKLEFAIDNAYIGNSEGISDILSGKVIVTVHVEQVD